MKKITFVALLIAILVSIIGVSAYLLKGLGRQEGKVSIQPEPTIPSQPEIDTSDWKIYQSPIMGFSVKYPAHWKVSPETLDAGARRIDFESSEDSENVNITFTVIERPTWYGGEEDFLKETRRVAGNNVDPEEELILLDNYPATAISYTQYWERSKQYVRHTEIYVRNKNFLIYFLVFGYDKNKKENYISLRNQLLSAFKFLK